MNMDTATTTTILLPSRLLTKKDLARMLDCTVRTVERMIEYGRIPSVRIPTATGTSSRVRFDPRVISEWLDQYQNIERQPPPKQPSKSDVRAMAIELLAGE